MVYLFKKMFCSFLSLFVRQFSKNTSCISQYCINWYYNVPNLSRKIACFQAHPPVWFAGDLTTIPTFWKRTQVSTCTPTQSIQDRSRCEMYFEQRHLLSYYKGQIMNLYVWHLNYWKMNGGSQSLLNGINGQSGQGHPRLEFQDASMCCPRRLLTPCISWFRMLILIYTQHLIWNNYIFAGIFCNGKLGTNKHQIFVGNAKWLKRAGVSSNLEILSRAAKKGSFYDVWWNPAEFPRKP